MPRSVANLTVGVALAVVLCNVSAAVAVEWIGTGGNRNWSNPANWNPVGIPPAGADIVINTLGPGPEPFGSVQDIANPFRVATLVLPENPAYSVTGFPIELADGGWAYGGSRLKNGLRTSGTAFIRGPSFQPLDIDHLTGSGTLVSYGSTRLRGITFDGQVTVPGGLELFTFGKPSTTRINGNLIVDDTDQIGIATLGGSGTIDFQQPGQGVTIADGWIRPGNIFVAGSSVGRLDILGDLAIRRGALIVDAFAFFNPPSRDEVHVSGTLTLSPQSSLALGHVQPTGWYTAMTYGNRIGEFGSVTLYLDGQFLNLPVQYTSPPNAGPGAVLYFIPEPALGSFAGLTMLLLLRRRNRARASTAASP